MRSSSRSQKACNERKTKYLRIQNNQNSHKLIFIFLLIPYHIIIQFIHQKSKVADPHSFDPDPDPAPAL
jgi:hypothetical protein